MFNKLYTFSKVGVVANSSSKPVAHSQDVASMTLLNEATSDNIGPFELMAGGWCGGNHSYAVECYRCESVCVELYLQSG